VIDDVPISVKILGHYIVCKATLAGASAKLFPAGIIVLVLNYTAS